MSNSAWVISEFLWTARAIENLVRALAGCSKKIAGFRTKQYQPLKRGSENGCGVWWVYNKRRWKRCWEWMGEALLFQTRTRETFFSSPAWTRRAWSHFCWKEIFRLFQGPRSLEKVEKYPRFSDRHVASNRDRRVWPIDYPVKIQVVWWDAASFRYQDRSDQCFPYSNGCRVRPVPRDAGIQKADQDNFYRGVGSVLLSMGRVSTERAEFEIGIHGLIATSTSPGRGGIHGLATSIACQHGHTLFNPQKRNKKQAEIMIDALIVSCLQTTAGANSGVFIECLGFRLNTCN